MSEESTFKTTQIGIFNPGRLSDREIERAFITRIKLFEYLLQGIVAETPGTIPQHYLVIGQRGMGKSTLLHRIAVELRKEPHRKSFLPLTFPEEQYNVDRLSKFWLNCLDALADALDREGSTDQLDQLDQDISHWASTARDSSAMQLYEHFAQWVHRTARRPVLLVDNLGLIFDRLSREEQHQLRAILMDKDAPILVGASANTLADTVDYGAPFYDAFQTQYLKKLTFEETMEVLDNLAKMTDNIEFANNLRGNRARLRTLYQLTGGTPRTIVMLYPLIRGGFSLEVQTDLEGLMDVMTPLYKARFEELPEQMQVILDAVALHWDPIALDDLRQITQLENSQLSPQLKRLYEVGWLDRLNAYQKKGQAYEISERFFNIWYLMRRSSRRQKKELLCLTKFLVTLYGEELNQMGERVMRQGATHRDHVSMQLAIADGVKDHELAQKLREKSYNELFELSKTDASILKDYEIPGEVLVKREVDLLENLLESLSSRNWSKIVTLCEELLNVNPLSDSAWNIIGNVYKIHFGHYEKAKAAYLKAIDLDRTKVAPWYGLGNLYHILGNYKGAEIAYYQIIKLDKTIAAPWFFLGNLYILLENYEEAEASYLQAIELDETFATPWYGLGCLYHINLGKYQQAESAYKRQIELKETFAAPWFNLGNLYQDYLKKYKEAEAAYIKATELDKTNIDPWNNLGNLYKAHLVKYKEAEEAYFKAIKLDETDAYPWNGLGSLYQDYLGKYTEAEAAYLRAIELDEKNIYPKLNLICLYRDKMDRLDDAKALFEGLEETEEVKDSYWLNASLFALYDKNLGITEKHLLQALHYTEGRLPPNTQEDWWRFAAVSINLGYGQAILDVLQKNGYDVILRPYFVAIQSLVAKDSTAFLNSIAAEVREVAADLAERIKRFM